MKQLFLGAMVRVPAVVAVFSFFLFEFFGIVKDAVPGISGFGLKIFVGGNWADFGQALAAACAQKRDKREGPVNLGEGTWSETALVVSRKRIVEARKFGLHSARTPCSRLIGQLSLLGRRKSKRGFAARAASWWGPSNTTFARKGNTVARSAWNRWE
jgi:hypothetical protein